MSATVLFDLDDTLLGNEMGRFLPAYFKLLQDGLAEVVPEEVFLPFFLDATNKMMAAEDVSRTLMDVFFEAFCASTNVERAEIQSSALRFYNRDYNALKGLTTALPAAQDVVREFHSRGYSLGVATNPLFPKAAIEKRILWADLPVENSHFKLITTGDDFHFAKPNPAYYAEAMAYLGWPEGPAVMIGNDPLNDIQGAGELGLSTYHVVGSSSGGEHTISGSNHAAGEIADVVTWIDRVGTEALIPSYRSSAAILAIFKSTAAVLSTYLNQCDDDEWDLRDGDEWSPREVLFHLKDVEEKVSLPRIESLVSQKNPFIQGVDTDAWYENGFPELATPSELLESFIEDRVKVIEMLSQMSEENWHFPARHAIFGPTDVLEIAYIMARHDQLHIRQLSRQLSILGQR